MTDRAAFEQAMAEIEERLERQPREQSEPQNPATKSGESE